MVQTMYGETMTKPLSAQQLDELAEVLAGQEDAELAAWCNAAEKIRHSPPGYDADDFRALIAMARGSLVMGEALEEAREQFALMAEGEGEDADVYMDMARYTMTRCDTAIRAADELFGEKT